MSNRSIVGAALLLGLGVSAQAELAVKAIAATGWGATLALSSDGTVWTLGGPAPVQVAGLSGITAIASGGLNLALKEDRSVWAWSYDLSGHHSVPVRLTGLDGVVAIAAASGHTLGLKRDGTVWAFGYNNHGQLGDGSRTDADALTPVQVTGLSGVVALAAGAFHSLALKGDRTVWAWGFNQNGQLGDGTTTARATPVRVSGLDGVRAISAGSSHSLAIKEDGTVWAWGSEWEFWNRATPVQVSGLTGITAIAAGTQHSLAVMSDGTVWAWGANWHYQLGDGTTIYRSAPVQVAGLAGVVAVAAGSNQSLALARDGTIWAWPTSYRPPATRAQVSGLSGITAVAAGGDHNLALKGDGTVWAWGYSPHGQLGDGTTTDRSAPGQVSGLDGVRVISANWQRSLALREDGTVWAWGYWDSGDRIYTHASPVPVSGLTEVVAIAAGYLEAKKDGTAWAWESATPEQVSGLSDVVAVAAADWAADMGAYSLALKSDGTVWTWGMGPPAELGGLSRVVAVSAGYGYYLAAKDDGTVWQWGDPRFGFPSTPSQVSGLSGVIALAWGDGGLCPPCGHSLALKSDGTVWAWGYNWSGVLGDGTSTSERMTPGQVGGLSRVVAIAASFEYSLAVKRDGTVWAWGDWVRDGRTLKTPVQVIQPGSPDLAIAMRHEGDFTVGSQGVYSLTVTNTGATPASGPVTVTDSLPPGLVFVSGIGTGWSCFAADADDEEVMCTNPGPVAPGASSTIRLTVYVGAPALPGLTNLATVANQSDRNVSNNTVCDPTVVLTGR